MHSLNKSSRKKASRSKSKYTGKSKNGILVGGFDTEDNGKGEATLFAIVHERGSYWTRNREEFIERLEKLSNQFREEGLKLELWATNLEYDLFNVFGADRIREVSLRFGKSYLVTATWKGIRFYDTVRHVPVSVKTIGEMIGLPKLTRDDSVGYCLRDAAITYRFAKELHNIYSDIGIELRSTLASTGYHLWLNNYFRKKVLPTPETIRESAKEAYHGGRTEAFSLGEFKNIYAIDVASMFPWAMITDEFPLPWGSIFHCNNLEEIDLALVRVKSNVHPGILPFRTNNGTIYPIGNWTGWYVGEELRYASSCGVKIEIITGYRFGDRSKPFDGYINDLFKKKAMARGVLRTLYKTLLNSLYGKFGQGGSRIVCIPLEKWEETRVHEDIARVWCGLVLYSVEATPPPWGNNIWSAIVTARARIKLHKEMERIKKLGGRIYYCDTDSIFFSGIDLKYPNKANKPGEFELRGFYSDMIIAGKKEYGIHLGKGNWDFHAKGIPENSREQYIRQGNAEFERPTRIREGARTGSRVNVWKRRVKLRRNSNIKRIRKPDGSLNPITICNGKINPVKGELENG